LGWGCNPDKKQRETHSLALLDGKNAATKHRSRTKPCSISLRTNQLPHSARFSRFREEKIVMIKYHEMKYHEGMSFFAAIGFLTSQGHKS